LRTGEINGPALQQQAARFVRAARAQGLADDQVLDLVRGALASAGNA
jgi:hypothetical protein